MGGISAPWLCATVTAVCQIRLSGPEGMPAASRPSTRMARAPLRRKRHVRYTPRATPRASNPGPRLALEAGTRTVNHAITSVPPQPPALARVPWPPAPRPGPRRRSVPGRAGGPPGRAPRRCLRRAPPHPPARARGPAALPEIHRPRPNTAAGRPPHSPAHRFPTGSAGPRGRAESPCSRSCRAPAPRSLARAPTGARAWPLPVRESPAWSGFLQRLGALQHFLDGPHHVERLLGHVVVLAVHNLAEAADGIGQLHVAALHSRELLGHVEGL